MNQDAPDGPALGSATTCADTLDLRLLEPLAAAVCRRVLGAGALADDASQEALLQALKTPPPPGADAAAWMHRVALNKALDLRRRERAHALRARPPAPMDDEPGSGFDRVQLQEEVDEALASLPDAARTLVLAHVLAGRTQRQLGTELGIDRSVVSRRLRTALEQLRAALRLRGVEAVDAEVVAVLAAALPAPCPAQPPCAGPARLSRPVLAWAMRALAAAVPIACACALTRGAPPSSTTVAAMPSGLGFQAAEPAIEIAFRHDSVKSALTALRDAYPPGAEPELWSSRDLSYTGDITWVPQAACAPSTARSAIARITGGTWTAVPNGWALTRALAPEQAAQWSAGLARLAAAANAGIAAGVRQTAASLWELSQQAIDDPHAVEQWLLMALDPVHPSHRAAAHQLSFDGSCDYPLENQMEATLLAVPADPTLIADIHADLAQGIDEATQIIALRMAAELRLATCHDAVCALLAAPGTSAPVRMAALDDLAVAGGPRDVPLVLASLASSPPNLVMASARALSRWGGPVAWSSLQARLASLGNAPDEAMSLRTYLERFPEALARKLVLHQLAHASSQREVIAAAEVVSGWGHAADQELLLTAARADGPLDAALADGLGRLADSTTPERLARLIAQRHLRAPPRGSMLGQDGLALARGLAAASDPACWRALRETVLHADDPVALAMAASTLAVAHRPDALPALLAAMAARANGPPAVLLALGLGAAQSMDAAVVAPVMGLVSDATLPAAKRAALIAGAGAPELQEALAARGCALRANASDAALVWGSLRGCGSACGRAAARETACDTRVAGSVRGWALMRGALGDLDLRALAHDQSPFVRACAIFELIKPSRTEPYASGPLLAAALAGDPAASVRAIAAAGMAMYEGEVPHRFSALMAALTHDPAAMVRAQVAHALIRYVQDPSGDAKARAALIATLRADQAAEVDASVAAAIADTLANRAIPILPSRDERRYWETSYYGLNDSHWEQVVLEPQPSPADGPDLPLGSG